MKLNIHPALIFRTPQFSYQSDIVQCWNELKKSISISSEAFYEQIKDIEAAKLHELPTKISFTIWKYFNRAQFRSTPYGTFASFGFIEEPGLGEINRIVVAEQQEVHTFIDWPCKNSMNFDFSAFLQRNGKLFSNSSYYVNHESIRYISCSEGLFELAEIDINDLVLQILELCKTPLPINELLPRFENEIGAEDLLSLIEDMVTLQLLLTEDEANIIGEDYFTRIHTKSNPALPKYLIAQREALSSSMDPGIFKALPELIDFLHQIQPAEEREALKSFKQKFQKRFDQQEIPLMHALDPEMGIGYDELEQAGGTEDFIAQFGAKPASKKQTELLKDSLKKELHPASFKKGVTIQLDKLSFQKNTTQAVLPNSFSVILSIIDDLLQVDQIGGSSANALSGRFTLADENMYRHCKKISALEQEANPEVLFFDVAYMAETNVDNINRRKLVYGHQVSILNYDTSKDPITLDDIWISVRAGEIVLRSEKLNSRIVPRLASAYNYTRSDLSVFRLLCDLQHQSIQTNLSLSLENLFPGLDFYPRLQYKNLIISPAKYKVIQEDMSKLNVEECRAYLTRLGLTGFFKTGLSDQTLCFNLNKDADLEAFLQYMQKQKNVNLEEVLVPKESSIIDQYGKSYLHQYILNLFHKETIYHGIPAKQKKGTYVTPFFPPGKEWLYFEIYCHHQRSDTLLGGPIALFLEQHQQLIKSWFFIRYNENGNHLRLRLLLKDKKEAQELMLEFSDYLDQELRAGLISDLQVKTYRRELERYGQHLIEEVETHFNADSEFVLSILPNNPSVFSKISWCGLLLDQIEEARLFDSTVFKALIRKLSDAFNSEHQMEASDFKKLNAEYQQYKNTSPEAFDEEQSEKFKFFAHSFIQILQLEEPGKRADLFGDLFHMHVNRLFNKNQRAHEMQVYYFLMKEIQRKQAMKN